MGVSSTPQAALQQRAGRACGATWSGKPRKVVPGLKIVPRGSERSDAGERDPSGGVAGGGRPRLRRDVVRKTEIGSARLKIVPRGGERSDAGELDPSGDLAAAGRPRRRRHVVRKTEKGSDRLKIVPRGS